MEFPGTQGTEIQKTYCVNEVLTSEENETIKLKKIIKTGIESLRFVHVI